MNGEHTFFSYENEKWLDQLTAVNGIPLTYDANGNLASYGDTTYTWSHGKQLASVTNENGTYNYTYDENGIRLTKPGYTFDTFNGRVLAQHGANNIYFQYNGDKPIGFILNQNQYYYITNPSGDIVGITDSKCDLIATYTYDEWGKLLSIETAGENNAEHLEIAETNPLRYRGYYYDNETGYYYLQSRYYDPELGRFISADDFSYINPDAPLNINAYSYCWNNPVALEDAEGTTPQISIDLTALQPLVDGASAVIKAGLNKFAENIKKLISKYNDFLDKLEFNINHPDVVINNTLSKIFGREILIKMPFLDTLRAYFGTFDIRKGELVGGLGDGYHINDSDNDESGIAPYYIINDDEKTDNWFEAILKALVIAIPINSITIEFEAVVQTYDRSFNFNDWFENLSYKTQSIITDIFVQISTIFHTAVKEHWGMLCDLIEGKVFDNLLDKNFANSSTGGEIPFFSILFDSLGILDSFQNGDYTYDQALLAIIFDVGLTALAFAFSDVGIVVGISGVVKLLGDNTRNGIFNYENGHLWG